MTMARKIEGYCQSHDTQEYLDCGNTVFVNRTQRILKDPYCTVVIHKGKPERVFTESEVMELRQADRRVIQRMVDHINNARNSGDAPYNSINDTALWQALSTAEAHGFTPTKP
jgi:hypothetical protein